MRVCALLAAMLLLGACAAIVPPPIPLDGLPSAFRMAGRLSVAHESQGEIFRLRWDRSAGSDAWTILTPVGNEVARIERSADGVRVFRPGASPLAASSLSEVTRALLGVELDERLLVAWLHGRALGGPAGWQVQTEPASDRPGVSRRVVATNGATTLRLVVDDYEARLP